MSIQDLETKAKAEEAKAALWLKTNRTAAIVLGAAVLVGFLAGKFLHLPF